MGSVRVNYKFYNNFSKFLKGEQLKHLNGALKVTRTVLTKIETAKLSKTDITIILGFKNREATIRLFRNQYLPIKTKYKLFLKKKYYIKEYASKKEKYYRYHKRGYITAEFFSELRKYDESLLEKAFKNVFKRIVKKYKDESVESLEIIKDYLNQFKDKTYFYDIPIYKCALLSHGIHSSFRSFYYNGDTYNALNCVLKNASQEEIKDMMLFLVKSDFKSFQRYLESLKGTQAFITTNYNRAPEDKKEYYKELALKTRDSFLKALPNLLNQVRSQAKDIKDVEKLMHKLVSAQEVFPKQITDNYLKDLLLAVEIPVVESSRYDNAYNYYKLLKLFQQSVKVPKRKVRSISTNKCPICKSELKENEKFLCNRCSNIKK